MLKRLLEKLENPDQPLLGPNVKFLKFWGLLIPENKIKRYILLILHLSVMWFGFTQYIDIWFIRSDIIQLLTNLKVSMLSTVNVTKVATFFIWQKDWKAIIEYVTKADLNQRAKVYNGNKLIVEKNTKYSRAVTFLYLFLTYSTALTFILQPVFKYVTSPTYRYNVRNGSEIYIQVVSSWVPFDKNVMPGYIFASLIQTYATMFAAGWIAFFDTTAIVVMVFFKGELLLLRRDSSYIFGNKKSFVSEEEGIARIKECQLRHVELVKYVRLFDSCLSPIMLLYMFVCSVMLCATLYQIRIEASPMQRFLLTQYLVFGVSQLFMFCWHSNDVFYVSKDLMQGPYDSTWWKRNISRQRDILLLIGQFNKAIIFTAGPFTDLTVTTFINIVKGAYSYYTLLTK